MWGVLRMVDTIAGHRITPPWDLAPRSLAFGVMKSGPVRLYCGRSAIECMGASNPPIPEGDSHGPRGEVRWSERLMGCRPSHGRHPIFTGSFCAVGCQWAPDGLTTAAAVRATTTMSVVIDQFST